MAFFSSVVTKTHTKTAFCQHDLYFHFRHTLGDGVMMIGPGCRYFQQNLIYFQSKTKQSAAEPEYKNLAVTVEETQGQT